MIKIVIALALFVKLAYAQHPDSVGAAILYSSSEYIETSDTVMPIPVVNYTYNNFYIRGLEFGYFYHYFLSFVAKPQMGGHDIQGVHKTANSIDAGVKLSHRVWDTNIELEILHDTLAKHKGWQSSLKLSKVFTKDRYIFIPNISVTYYDSSFSQYYYGVEGSQRFDDYSLGGSYDTSVGFVAIYNFHTNYALTLIANRSFLDSDKYNSPLVDSKTKDFLLLSAVYMF